MPQEEKKPYFIKIVGARVVKQPNGSKIAELQYDIIDDQSFANISEAGSFANQKANKLKQEKRWSDMDVTVIEWVPVKKAIYSLHQTEIKKFLDPFFRTSGDAIMSNRVLTDAQDKLADNDHKLLVDIIISFLKNYCREFVEYRKEVRESDMKSYEMALKHYIVAFYQDWQGRAQAEVADNSA